MITVLVQKGHKVEKADHIDPAWLEPKSDMLLWVDFQDPSGAESQVLRDVDGVPLAHWLAHRFGSRAGGQRGQLRRQRSARLEAARPQHLIRHRDAEPGLDERDEPHDVQGVQEPGGDEWLVHREIRLGDEALGDDEISDLRCVNH